MSGALLVVGDLATDVVAVHRRPLAPATDTPARIVLRPGGAAANVAAWAAAAGAEVTLLARVGADSADRHRAELRGAGVRPVLREDRERPTAAIVCLVDATGERTMLNDRGASSALGPADWDEGLLDGVARVHLSGYLFFSAPGRDLAALVLRTCRPRGVPVSVDPASTGPLAELGTDAFLDLAAGADLLLPNADEARLLAGRADAAQAGAALSRRTGALVAVKLGAAGVVLCADGEALGRVPAADALVVDTVGAGDAFAGGFLAARLRGAEPLDAAVSGCAAAARCVTRLGARP
ncbi:carbohydrate kinase family protein [Streptacidiphilus jiangxiensis]|uniref:Sugar or nucleoside kinase, ribokinase family n=1 Tax=Streptacidiphilus jiangxiensis TaxID=235985 RepID=A0A1H7QMD9_STRJI|nr:PfkB family carbohydrate kinase [Streptacidiphilus jiangxiensis]SEL48898.1 Sugar or nucleoside kinase, ribokinase family [Streptacidiphilus jiangxiensis]